MIKTTHPETIVEQGGPSPVPTYTHIDYDGLGRKSWQSEITTQSYASQLVDADGQRWFEYDIAGRLVKVTLSKPTVSDYNPVYRYIYDGHGSTRQLAEWTGSDVTIADSFSYDGYGVLLQDNSVASTNPGYTAAQATNLLYAGEHFDTDAQQYYNRARWYNPLNGLFNRMDPYSGSLQDPQSLHKYTYVHNNPINNIDPSGMMSLVNLSVTTAITALISGIVFTATSVVLNAAYGVSGIQML